MLSARLTLVVYALLAIAGIGLAGHKGRLPHPELAAAEDAGNAPTAADLQLYREIIAEVRGGADYYEVARQKLPQFGFPISSPFNWRLPTYAWLFASVRDNRWLQGALIALGVGGLGLAFVAERRRSNNPWQSLLVAGLLFGVFRWTFDGEAYLAQEVWAGVLLMISLAAQFLAGEDSPPARSRWIVLSVLAGTAALLIRELALPYCLLAGVLAAGRRRWWEAAGWIAGILAFGLFLAWHIGQVQHQQAGASGDTAAGLGQWLRFGGLDFVLLTTRMNSLGFTAPAMLLWLYVLAAAVGSSRQTDSASRLGCLAAQGYLLAFAVVGRPENFYWGLLAAPFLAWGAAQAPAALAELWRQAHDHSATRLSAPIRPAI
ncbi:MAG: hypothetical protein SFU86_03970 [Pirellulaceae bacterium]|nr:hypothetical protein [Pirellulaceae bacterium]